jgi:hypothetical protein
VPRRHSLEGREDKRGEGEKRVERCLSDGAREERGDEREREDGKEEEGEQEGGKKR